MDWMSRRKLIRTILPDDCGDISSDGRTVWINKGVCIARFCPESREYVPVSRDDSRTGLEYEGGMRPHPQEGATLEDWLDFVNGVKGRWGIVIGQEHTPLYIKGPDSATEASPTT